MLLFPPSGMWNQHTVGTQLMSESLLALEPESYRLQTGFGAMDSTREKEVPPPPGPAGQ